MRAETRGISGHAVNIQSSQHTLESAVMSWTGRWGKPSGWAVNVQPVLSVRTGELVSADCAQAHPPDRQNPRSGESCSLYDVISSIFPPPLVPGRVESASGYRGSVPLRRMVTTTLDGKSFPFMGKGSWYLATYVKLTLPLVACNLDLYTVWDKIFFAPVRRCRQLIPGKPPMVLADAVRILLEMTTAWHLLCSHLAGSITPCLTCFLAIKER